MKFDLKLKWEDLYHFNLYQAYHGLQGWISIVFAVVIIGLGIYACVGARYAAAAVYVVVGVFIVIYVPLELRRRSQRTFKNSNELTHQLHFEISEEKIFVTQGEESAELPWKSVYKVRSDKHDIFLYSSRYNAYIIPRDQIAEHYDTFKELATKNLPKICVSLK